MKLKVFSIYDSKAEAYLQPFHAPTVGHALRSVENELSRPESTIARWPEDFTLFEIGSYDDASGNYEMLAAHKSLGKAIELKRTTQ